MLKTRKKIAALAVVSAIGSGAMLSAPVQALNVSQNNLGEVLLFPYYTVKNGFDTVFTVTNTTDKTAAFKIRFREALNSREVRDFNVVLSPYDHWSGAVTAKGDGAAFRTYDKSCTSPDKPAWTDVGNGGYEVDFTNALFTGIYRDGATEDMSRVQEGYFEVILMGLSPLDTATPANVVEYSAKHVDGVPRDCAAVDEKFLNVTSSSTNTAWDGFDEPANVLKGHVMYIDVATGKAIDAEPTAIENFKSGTHILAKPGDLNPSLASGDAGTVEGAAVNVLADGVVIEHPYTGSSHNAVSMALMATSVINEFATGSGAATSWVVTFPTKHHFTDVYTLEDGTADPQTAGAPFTNWFYQGADGGGQSCDTISMTLTNREEGRVVQVSNTGFSPQPPVSSTVSLCHEVNVINFNSTSNVFGNGTNRLTVDTSGVGSAGWAQLSFTGAYAIGSTEVTTGYGLQGFVGLPTIGFAAVMRDAGGASVNYGSAVQPAYISGARAAQ